jgi:hypothetical protein
MLDAAKLKSPVAGLYISSLEREVPLDLTPPAIRTVPSGSRVAVCAVLAALM